MLPVHYTSASLMAFTSAYVLAPASPPSLAARPVCFEISFQPPTLRIPLHIPLTNHWSRTSSQVWRIAFRETFTIRCNRAERRRRSQALCRSSEDKMTEGW